MGDFTNGILGLLITGYLIYNIPGSSDEQTFCTYAPLGVSWVACDKARTQDPERRGEGSGIGISAAVIKRMKLASRGRWPRLAALEKR